MGSVGVPDRGARSDHGIAGYALPPEAGRRLLGDRVQVKLGAGETGEAFFLFHATTPPGHGPPLHAHEREDETFYILEGRYDMQLGGATREVVPAGSCLHLPRYRAHGFINVDSSDGAFVGLATPGGLERYFEAVSALGPNADDLEQRSAIGLPYGVHFPRDPSDLAPGGTAESVANFVHVPPGGGRALPSPAGSVRCLLGSGETRGACALLEVELPPSGSWPAWAAREQRVLYVLDGELEVEAGGRLVAGPGTAVYAPSGTSLRIGARGGAGARFLLYTV